MLSLDPEIQIDATLWANSRSGARAGRGFRYQDAVGAWLATQIWAGTLDAKALVPEGLDDLTMHGGAVEIRVQAKARHDPRGCFTTAELAKTLIKSAATIEPDALRSGSCRIVLILERRPEALSLTGWEGNLSGEANRALLSHHLEEFISSTTISLQEFLAAATIVSIDDPLDRSVAILCERRDAVDAVGRHIAHCLRFLVGDRADENFRAPADRPGVVAAADVESVVQSVFSLVDRTALFPAIAAGLCEPVAFAPTSSPNFYEGVDVTPGHVASGLVLDRPELVKEVLAGLERQRCVLIAGPSGSGKTAAAWLSAYQTRHVIRWYRVRRLVPDQIHLLADLASILEASPDRPVGFVCDDVGRDFSDVWDALATELRHQSGTLLLGTIREEDLFLVGNLSATAVARPILDAELAERVWAALRAERDLQFPHWREPFERSNGLLLEYVHLLTSGQRLQEVLDAQVHRRLLECRDAELAILQATIPAARFGGTVDIELMRSRLQLSQGDCARALARLVDEHAVRINEDGSIGGLHQIRSSGLYTSLQRHVPRQLKLELAETVDVLCANDFSIVLPHLLRAHPEADGPLLEALAERVPALKAAEMAPIFHGLGLAGCDRVAERWIAITDEQGVDQRVASLGFSLALAGSSIDLPQLQALNSAISRFPEVEQPDLRTNLLERINDFPEKIEADLDDLHELAASLVPLSTLSPAPDFKVLPAGDWGSVPLEQGLELAATLREFDAPVAEAWLNLLGGTEQVLSRIHGEVAWVTRPALRSNEDGQLVVSSDVRFQGDSFHGNANDVVVAHCERLLAAVPTADVAASSMLGWDGKPAGFANYPLAVKNIPRGNLPSRVRIAWNRAAVRAIERRTGSKSESARANALFVAITELSSFLADAAEIYCRGSAADEKFKALLKVRGLLNSFIEPPTGGSATRSARDEGGLSASDKALDFVSGVTGLAQELCEDIGRPLLASVRAAKLREEANALLSADGWRWIEAPPTEELQSLIDTLNDLDAIFGDAHANPEAFRRSRLLAERTSRKHRARIRFGHDARSRAARSVEHTTAGIREALAAKDMDAYVIARPMDDVEAPYWPRVDYAALLPVGHLTEFMLAADDLINTVDELPNVHRVAIAPVRDGLVVAALAGVVYSQFLPMLDFAEKWSALLPFPLLEENGARALNEAFNVLLQLSATAANADRDLNPEETQYAEGLVESVRGKLAFLLKMLDGHADPDIAEACKLIQEVLHRVQQELSGDGSSLLAAEIARMANGEPTDFSTRIISYRIGLLERDVIEGKSNR